MPSYDDDLPTQQEESLLKKLVDSTEHQERIKTLMELKNLIIGSKRCKIAFYHVGILETLQNLLKDYSSTLNVDILIEILDCISSFAKSDNQNLIDRLIQLGFIEQILVLLTSQINANHFYEACLRCLRSFFVSKIFSNPYLAPTPFILLSDENKYDVITIVPQMDTSLLNETFFPVDIVFENSQTLDVFHRLLSISKKTQMSIIEILCYACTNNERQNQIVEIGFISSVMHLLVENIVSNSKTNLVSTPNEYLIGVCLKFFCSICYENVAVAHRLRTTICHQTNQTLCEIISNLLDKINQPVIISYYASKFFTNLCKTKVLQCDDPYISQKSLTTLIHLCTKSILNKCVYLYVACLDTLIYLLNGNSALHHTAMYTEQFLSKLFSYLFTPNKIFNEDIDDTLSIKIRSSALTLLAILSSHHEDIKKRIAEKENLISTAIECYNSSNISLQLAALYLFHGLSRSVHQLRTTFNDAICDLLLDAIKSNEFSLVKVSSSVISNAVLEFSTCRSKLISGGILDILLAFLTHSDRELSINGIWALRNLSYLSTLKTKQDIINGLTIDRIYSFLEHCRDERFLICLLTLLRNVFNEKDMETLLPMFNATKLIMTLKRLSERKYPTEVHREINLLLEYVSSGNNTNQTRSSIDSINPTCRTSLFPQYAWDEMDELD